MATPHDALFKQTFSDPSNAAGELRSILPAAIVAAIDWSTLRLCPGSTVDDELAELHSDLIYQALIGGRPGYVYLLLEHRSWQAPMTAFHLLRYMVRIWERHLQEADTSGSKRRAKLPPIVPIVIAHGKRRWRVDTSFAALVDFQGLDPATVGALRALVPDFRFVLDDLRALSEGDLHQRTVSAAGKLTLLCLQQLGRSKAPLDDVLRWISIFRDIAGSDPGAPTLAAVLRYIMLVTNIAARDLAEVMRSAVSPQTADIVMSTGQRLIQQGRREGRAEGKAEGHIQGQRAVLIRQLTTRFGQLPQATADRIANASSVEVELWVERVLSAPSLASVLE